MIFEKIYSLPIIKTIVYANVFISLCALAMVFTTYKVFSIPFNYQNNSYLLFIFLSTYLQYNVQRGYSIFKTDNLTERSLWVNKNKKALLITIGISLITILFLCNYLSYTSIAIMVVAELLSTLYYLPPFNFRKYGYIKPFLISLVWIASCVIVPLFENKLLDINSIWFNVSQFLFIAYLCILFDIKDADDDFISGVNTYANKFGLLVTKIISIVLIILMILCYLLFNHQTIPLFKISIVIGFISALFISISNDKRHPFFYYLWIDGLILLQAMIVYILS